MANVMPNYSFDVFKMQIECENWKVCDVFKSCLIDKCLPHMSISITANCLIYAVSYKI